MASKYKIAGDGIKDTETGAFIPNASGNRHWQEYQTWLADSTSNIPDPEFTEQELEDQAWASLRAERDSLLTKTDFMMTQDYYASMTSQEQTDVTAYRSDLRDLPGDTVDPTDPTWPTKPQIVIDNGI